MVTAMLRSDGRPVAVVHDGKVSFIAENMATDDVTSVMLATVGWSGARKLAKHCIVDLTVEIYRRLDLERANDFVEAYVAVRERHPELEPKRARLLVMPYWLFAMGPHPPLLDANREKLEAWLKPALFKKRGKLERVDFVTLAHMGVKAEAEAARKGEHSPISLM